MAYRIAAPSPPSSMFKSARLLRERRKDLGRSPRQRNEAHLGAVRLLPCLVCARSPVEAAHIRMSAPGKPNAGIGARPDDSATVPMCHEHHMEQHGEGERNFYDRIGIDALKLAAALYRASPNVQKMRGIILAHHLVVTINLGGGKS